MTNANGYHFSTASMQQHRRSGCRESEQTVCYAQRLCIDQAACELREGVANKQTGEYATYINMGAEVYLDNLNVGVSYRKPVMHCLSESELWANAQLTTHNTFLF